jgi:5'-nucleotidase
MKRPYYWLGGRFVSLDEGRDTDLHAVKRGYVSVTPIHYDLTAYEALDRVSAWAWPEAREVPVSDGRGR